MDYRGLNTVTSGDGYPIPSVSNVLDALSGGKTFAKLDLASGYWEILVNPDHVYKTAFATHLLYEFPTCCMASKLPLRLFSESSTQCLPIFSTNGLSFTLMMSLSRQTLILSLCLVMNVFLNVLPNLVFGIKPTKSDFFSQDLEMLGHRVTPLGWFPTSKGTEVISAMPHPHNVSSVKRFLVMVNYFCGYVRSMASRTKHLRSLLCKGTPVV